MPVKTEPKERPIIRMLLSACDNGAWKDASLDWVEEKQDGAVEENTTAPSGATLALEHTLIQPFVGEKLDSQAFMKAFGRIEKKGFTSFSTLSFGMSPTVPQKTNGFATNRSSKYTAPLAVGIPMRLP